MRIAVLTLTRDRLDYTRHCFQTLRENAGCDYDHHVLDQGSDDGTPEWLMEQYDQGQLEGVYAGSENVGCCRGWNFLVEAIDLADYDVIVCFDNDCEVVTPNTLACVAHAAHASDYILAPRVHGLVHPPPAVAHGHILDFDFEETTILGNIFMAIPAFVLDEEGFRWDERYAVWDGGESVTQWYRDRAGKCGYLPEFRVNHYKTTLGQVEDIPWYFRRRVAEGGRAQ